MCLAGKPGAGGAEPPSPTPSSPGAALPELWHLLPAQGGPQTSPPQVRGCPLAVVRLPSGSSSAVSVLPGKVLPRQPCTSSSSPLSPIPHRARGEPWGSGPQYLSQSSPPGPFPYCHPCTGPGSHPLRAPLGPLAVPVPLPRVPPAFGTGQQGPGGARGNGAAPQLGQERGSPACPWHVFTCVCVCVRVDHMWYRGQTPRAPARPPVLHPGWLRRSKASLHWCGQIQGAKKKKKKERKKKDKSVTSFLLLYGNYYHKSCASHTASISYSLLYFV